MTAHNKQALREAAENATAGQWVVELGDEVYAVDGDDSEQIAMVFSDNGRSDAAFIAAASPVAVLSLLDENLQLQRDKGSLEAVAIAMRDDMRESREKLEAAENNLIDSEFHAAELEEALRDKQALLEALDNALCELLPGTQYMDPPDGGSVTPLEQVRRMVADYRGRIEELESRTVSVHWPVPKDSTQGWKVDPEFISKVQDAIGYDEECQCWEGTPSMEMVESVLIAAAGIKLDVRS
ncbi:ead/Ea22-like family protein [Citrobacter freundii]|uniref:Ead/Ea22-like family protein n=1 Tax=Citrobacter freundii TaxID=546 RepID=A0AAP5XZE8_CITFR|nr:ead/Ea22-like family protein [Citrobacter freundii]MDW2761769.1 ead/Ea22-like family protein [Citrobacter freundii]WHW88234.1 ead/Ea22-like family protein [Citrobacter freundii]